MSAANAAYRNAAHDLIRSPAMSRLGLAVLTSVALSLFACAEKPGAKKDDKKEAKDAKDSKARPAKADGKVDAKTDKAKPAE